MSLKGRIPIIPLSWEDRFKAVPGEFVVDRDNGKVFIASSNIIEEPNPDTGEIIRYYELYDMTEQIAEYLKDSGISGNAITVDVETLGEQRLQDIINIIYKNETPSDQDMLNRITELEEKVDGGDSIKVESDTDQIYYFSN